MEFQNGIIIEFIILIIAIKDCEYKVQKKIQRWLNFFTFFKSMK